MVLIIFMYASRMAWRLRSSSMRASSRTTASVGSLVAADVTGSRVPCLFVAHLAFAVKFVEEWMGQRLRTVHR